MAASSPTVPDVCLVGVKRPDSLFAYATVRWLHRSTKDGKTRLGGSFLTGDDDPLDPSKLSPRLNKASLQLAPALSQFTIEQWAQLGVARPFVIDRVLGCPTCQAMPTFRNGCPTCGSPGVGCTRLIHHFACAHVAKAGEFERDGSLGCPKCRARNLVVGADFEHLDGPASCRDCGWSGSSAVLIGECLSCGRRFPGSDAREMEVIQYHVERMDPCTTKRICC